MVKSVRSLFTRFIPRSALRIPEPRYFSPGQQGVLFFLALLILGILYLRFTPPSLGPSLQRSSGEVVIEVSGAVKNPGPHLFSHPPTVQEAIERAGGLKEAAVLEDPCPETLETGSRIHVARETPGMIRVRLGRMDASKMLVFSIPLDLNRASVEDLSLVPGIGDSLAREIVAYRSRRRGFHSVRDLANVKGIGEKKVKGLERYFMVPDSEGAGPVR
jgi:competence ComEA-like helix-hairpin-helix protein